MEDFVLGLRRGDAVGCRWMRLDPNAKSIKANRIKHVEEREFPKVFNFMNKF